MAELAPYFTQPVVTLPEESSLADVARKLTEGRFRHLVLVDRKGRARGVATDADVLRMGRFSKAGAWAWSDASHVWMKAGDVALPVPTPTPRTLSLVSAIDRLLREANRFLLAQDDFKRPVGVFTERDVLRIAARTLPPGTPYQPPPTAPIVASPSDRSGDVYRRMEQHHIRHLPVLEAGRVIGVVFRRDLLREDAFSLREVRLADLGAMSPAVTAPVGLTLKQVAEKLFDDRLGCLPLLNPDGSLATIATITDVIRTFRARIP